MNIRFFKKLRCLQLRVSLNMLQRKRVKHKTNTNEKMPNKRKFCCPILKLQLPEINILYRMFTECTNRCDVDENFRNTKKPTISLLPELHYRSNFKLNIKEILWRFPENIRVYKLA